MNLWRQCVRPKQPFRAHSDPPGVQKSERTRSATARCTGSTARTRRKPSSELVGVRPQFQRSTRQAPRCGTVSRLDSHLRRLLANDILSGDGDIVFLSGERGHHSPSIPTALHGRLQFVGCPDAHGACQLDALVSLGLRVDNHLHCECVLASYNVLQVWREHPRACRGAQVCRP